MGKLLWYIQRVAVVYCVIAKIKSTPSPRPKTGVRQKAYPGKEVMGEDGDNIPKARSCTSQDVPFP